WRSACRSSARRAARSPPSPPPRPRWSPRPPPGPATPRPRRGARGSAAGRGGRRRGRPGPAQGPATSGSPSGQAAGTSRHPRRSGTGEPSRRPGGGWRRTAPRRSPLSTRRRCRGARRCAAVSVRWGAIPFSVWLTTLSVVPSTGKHLGSPADDFPVDLRRLPCGLLPRGRGAVRGPPQGFGNRRISERPLDRGGDGYGVGGIEPSLGHGELGDGGRVGGDHGSPAGHGLDDGQAVALVEGGEDEQVGGLVGGDEGRVVHVA